MKRVWKVKGDPSSRAPLFCRGCERCMSSKEDVRSRDERGGYCADCSPDATSERLPELVVVIDRSAAK